MLVIIVHTANVSSWLLIMRGSLSLPLAYQIALFVCETNTLHKA